MSVCKGKSVKFTLGKVAKEIELKWIEHSINTVSIKHIKDEKTTKKNVDFMGLRSSLSSGQPSAKIILQQIDDARSVKDQTKVIYSNVLMTERNLFNLPFLHNSEKSIITSNVTHILILD